MGFALDTIPLSQVESSAMEDVAVSSGKALSSSCCESTEPGEGEMLCGPEEVVVEKGLGEAARNESCIVGIAGGCKDDLLEAIVEVTLEHFNFIPNCSGICGAAMQRYSA